MNPNLAAGREPDEAFRLFSAYRDLLQAAYQSYNLSLPKGSPTCSPGCSFSLDRSMEELLGAFEKNFSERLTSFSYSQYELFKWLLVDKPNNIFIDSFHKTGGGLNSIVFGRILSEPSIEVFLRKTMRPTIRERRFVNIHVPFCGKSFELPGLVRFLESEFSSFEIKLTLTDIDTDDLEASELLLSAARSTRPQNGDRDASLVKVQFRAVDLETEEQPHCNLVIGIHPQLFNRYERFISKKWRSILRNVLANADAAILFFLSPSELKAAMKFLGNKYRVEEIQNSNYVVMPRSYVKGTHVRGLGLRGGHDCYRYYGYPITVLPLSNLLV